MRRKNAGRILLIDNSCWNIYNFRFPLLQELFNQGYEVVLATPLDDYFAKLDSAIFARHIALRKLNRQGRNPLEDLALVGELLGIISEVKPSLVINFTIKPNIYGSIAARILNVPAIVVITGMGYSFLHPRGLMRVVPMLYRLAFQKLKKIVVYNHEDRKLLLQRNLTTPSQCEVILGDGVDTNHFNYLPANHLIKKPRPFIFLFIGRLLKDKGILEYVEAAKKLQENKVEVECWVLGGLGFGNPAHIQQEELENWINRKYIKYLGTTNDIRIPLAKAHTLVLPSHREGMPRAILEAMSMGKPIITTDAAGCSETVEDGINGFKVPVKDTHALYEAMQKLRQIDPMARHEMGFQGRQMVVERFGREVIQANFMAMIETVLSP